MSFRSSIKQWYVECIQNGLDEAILFSARKIHFHDKIVKKKILKLSINILFLEL